ncbi:oligoendopeptidase F [Ignavigranum ruoffiae]|uniref:oligoendopeptidase F n=1 Tax=Ignavigranum ruoffiae TaxID=89093 RepID=UPI002046E69A|nr:oligoendopeptidase F [Ignavigranum ruoffiae]UPQ85361.1 oligoendopeptidase F [Ignavigranum ruoffiae]
MALAKREDLPIELTWDLSHLYPDQNAFETDVARLKNGLNDFQNKYQGKIDSSLVASQAILDLEQLTILSNWTQSYGFLAYSVDRTQEINEKNVILADELGELFQQKTAFFMPELLSQNSNILQELRLLPEMKPFVAYIDQLERQRPHLFDAHTESILGALSGTLFGQEKIFSSIKFEDLTFEDFQADGQSYQNSFPAFEGNFETHSSIEVRHQSWKSFHQGLAKYQHTAARNYINLVQTHKKMATLRGFDSVFDYLLDNQQVSQATYHRIIDTLMDEWAPVMRRFAKMMAKEHGLAKISLADIKASFSQDEVAEVTVEKARQLVQNALKPLGQTYNQIISQAFADRWIDYPMNQTKSTGGFCASPYQKPSYILLNWTGLLNEALVLAHELGHAGHFSLSAQHQAHLVNEPSMFFVEAPSTCNEVITCQYLLNQPLNNKEKRALIASFIQSTYYHNMVTHLLEAVYQRKVYQAVDRGELLNADRLNQFFRESLEEFWAGAVEINEGAELTWMRQPHYFDGLYSYTYSAGLAIGTQVGQRIANYDQAAIDAWLNVLKLGGSQMPIELAKLAGVDLTTTEPLKQAIQYVSQLLDQIESLV